jgi:hypothetical protein
MVSHHCVYQLVLFALIWLFIIVHLTRSKPAVVASATPVLPEPRKPTRHRPDEPKPFEGLTHKPHCALCERETVHPQAPPPVPPDPMPPTNRRPREIDTSLHFCPHAGCEYRGWFGLGNLRANGHPSGGPWRQFHCTSCDSYFLETHDTVAYLLLADNISGPLSIRLRRANQLVIRTQNALSTFLPSLLADI